MNVKDCRGVQTGFRRSLRQIGPLRKQQIKMRAWISSEPGNNHPALGLRMRTLTWESCIFRNDHDTAVKDAASSLDLQIRGIRMLSGNLVDRQQDSGRHVPVCKPPNADGSVLQFLPGAPGL